MMRTEQEVRQAVEHLQEGLRGDLGFLLDGEDEVIAATLKVLQWVLGDNNALYTFVKNCNAHDAEKN